MKKCCTTCVWFVHEERNVYKVDKLSDLRDVEIIESKILLNKCKRKGYLNKKMNMQTHVCSMYKPLISFGQNIYT